MLVELLRQDDVDTTGIRTLANERTGSAIVMVDDSAENSILINSGANTKIVLTEIEQLKEIIEKSDYIVAQLETNIDAIIEAFRLTKKSNTKTILNPEPAFNQIPETLLRNTDILIPNQNEAELIAGIKIRAEEQLVEVANQIKFYGIELVIITPGAKGVYYLDKNGDQGLVPAQRVTAIDTTAAGGTFIGALALILKKDYSNLQEAIDYDSKASALTVQRFGAQPSIPYANEIE